MENLPSFIANDPSCIGKSNGYYWEFSNPDSSSSSSCLFDREINGTHIIYKTTVESKLPEAEISPLITRSRNLIMDFACFLEVSFTPKSISENFPFQTTADVSLKSAIDSKQNHHRHEIEENGNFEFEMKLFRNQEFREKQDLPLTVTIPESIYLGIEIKESELHRTEYKTIIESCWATPR